MPCSAENPWILISTQMPNTVVDRVHPLMANYSPQLQCPPSRTHPALQFTISPLTQKVSSSFCAITNFVLFCLAGMLCCVLTSTSRPNLHWWPCRSQNERRKEDRMRREDCRKWGPGLMLGLPVGWELFSVSQLSMDQCLVNMTSFSATSAITLSFLQPSSTPVTTLAQEF